MKIRSLKVRLLIVQAIVIVLTLTITEYGLTSLFERHVERRIGSELNTYLNQIAARITINPDGSTQLTGKLADPRFDNIYSGLYWQITNENSHQTIRSRSLWDTKLALEEDDPELGKIHTHFLGGPQNSSLLIHERRLVFSAASETPVLRLALAIDLAELKITSREFSEEVTAALFILGGLLFAASWVQVALGLRPLSLIQNSISAIRKGKQTRISPDLPTEVSPLVDEVNSLLSSQEQTIQAARNRAGDLAHGFKTPLTALKADIRKLQEKGETDIAAGIEQTFFMMQRQIERELAKTRQRDTSSLPPVKLSPLLDSLIKTIKRTPEGETKSITLDCDENLQVIVQADDLADIIGNLLENAAKHANENILVTVQKRKNDLRLTIEDDGTGISKAKRQSALKRGVKLDEKISGSGLGLAIVSDLLEIYGQKLTLETSKLGGLRAQFDLPVSSNFGQ